MSFCRKGADERVLHFLAAANANLAIVERRAVATRGGEYFLGHRVIDRGGFHAPLDLYAHRHAKLRKTVQEVGRAVERIDNPDRVGFTTRAGLFGEDGVVGVVVVNDLDDRGFGGTVDLADEIVVSFLLDLELVELVVMPDQYGAATACCHHGHIQ